MTPAVGPGIFPLPVLADPPSSSTRSRRLQVRQRAAKQVTDIANDSIAALNELHESFFQPSTTATESLTDPSVSIPFINSEFYNSTSSAQHPSSVPQARSPPLATQARIAGHIYSRARRFHRRRALSGAVCDDSLSSILMDQENHLLSAGYSNAVAAAAVPLIADKVALPSAAGLVNLTDVLPPEVAAFYADPSKCVRPEEDRPPLPRAAKMASPTEYLKLVKRLVQANMVEFTTTPIVVNGVFTVPKPDGAQRFIVDARRANSVFAEPPHVSLPTPDLLPRLIVPDNKPVWVAKSDLSDFFFRFRIPAWMVPYFGLPSISSNSIPTLLARFGPNVTVYPCLVVLAMGWSHSVYLTQTAHEHMLNTRTTLRPEDRITRTADLRIDRVRHLVYVDDLIIIGPDKEAVAFEQQAYIKAAEAIDLPVKPSKVVLPSADGVDCLGIEFNGREHTVAPAADKVERLRIDTVRVIQRGRCTGRDLARLVGRWTWSMLVARPSLSVFNTVYRFIEDAGRKEFSLWHSVARELWAIARIAPLLVATLSSTWDPSVLAVDASLDGQGVVASSVASNLVESAARTAGSVAAKTEADLDLDHSVLDRRWSTLVASPWREEEHINSLEIRSISTAVRRVLSNPLSINRRLLILSDSQVAVGALTKGRSSSHDLLRRIRPISALLLGSGLRLYLRWIPSASNPADAPSRYFSNPAF